MIDCADCKLPFTFSAGEQSFYGEKGLSVPKRCKSCRVAKRNNPPKKVGAGIPQDYTCAQCGVTFTFSFPLKLPAYCRDCFTKRKDA